MSRPGSNNKPGNTNHKNDHSDVECYLCHKKGHHSNNCPKRLRVFAAQVIDEDTEPASSPEDKDDDWEVSRSHDNDLEADHLKDPNGSQYDSG